MALRSLRWAGCEHVQTRMSAFGGDLVDYCLRGVNKPLVKSRPSAVAPYRRSCTMAAPTPKTKLRETRPNVLRWSAEEGS